MKKHLIILFIVSPLFFGLEALSGDLEGQVQKNEIFHEQIKELENDVTLDLNIDDKYEMCNEEDQELDIDFQAQGLVELISEEYELPHSSLYSIECEDCKISDIFNDLGASLSDEGDVKFEGLTYENLNIKDAFVEFFEEEEMEDAILFYEQYNDEIEIYKIQQVVCKGINEFLVFYMKSQSEFILIRKPVVF